ncbi:MAG: VTT domain-containing protein [Candidatus Aenigmarchaeota archaeon]|nr:VTT domain-containing protein [Candidatus Aenigmarchaeota archaeon]
MVLDAATLISLVHTFGYLGVFVGSILTSLTLFIPVPGFIFVVTAGALLNPFWVGIAAGVGAAIGELVGYPIGRGINYGLKKKKKIRQNKGMFKLIREWFNKKRGPLIIFLFAVSPLPDDFVVIFCGLIKYDAKKLFLSLLAGKILFSLALAYAGYYGIEIASGFL